MSKFQSEPCNHVEVISSLRLKSGFEKNAFKVWSLKFKVIDRAQRALRGAAKKSLAELFKKFSYYKTKCILFLWY